MKLGLMLHDPEEEHDCFSDNTHNSHYYDIQSASRTSTAARYPPARRQHGRGPEPVATSCAQPIRRSTTRCSAQLDATQRGDAQMKDAGDGGAWPTTRCSATATREGNAMVQAAIDALLAQTKAIEQVVPRSSSAARLEGSDSLDDPERRVPVTRGGACALTAPVRRRWPRSALGGAALALLPAPAAAMAARQRAAILAPTTDFSKAERCEALPGRRRHHARPARRAMPSRMPSANLSFEERADFSIGNGLFTRATG